MSVDVVDSTTSALMVALSLHHGSRLPIYSGENTRLSRSWPVLYYDGRFSIHHLLARMSHRQLTQTHRRTHRPGSCRLKSARRRNSFLITGPLSGPVLFCSLASVYRRL